MGTVNILILPYQNPETNETSELRIQFSYGFCWQDEYHLGDKIKWSRSNVGVPGKKKVVVYGILEDFPNCSVEHYEIHLSYDIIQLVIPYTGKYNLFAVDYIVIED